MDNKKDKRTVWIYAVILFTSAFIVLIVTAFSQIKVNQNIYDVRNKLGATEKEKSNFQMNLSSALAENEKLNEEIKKLEKEIEDKRIEESNLKKELSNIKDINTSKFTNYEKLMLAYNKYNTGDVKGCSLILINEIDKGSLDKNAIDMYNSLSGLSNIKASLEFYIDGYNSYKKDDFNKAIESFKNSLSLTVNEYYSDDCYYFIAYSYFYINNKDLAKETMNTLLKYYPESTYKKDAVRFLETNYTH